jgi:hypothetical protein
MHSASPMVLCERAEAWAAPTAQAAAVRTAALDCNCRVSSQSVTYSLKLLPSACRKMHSLVAKRHAIV